jgi:hypothetical protein
MREREEDGSYIWRCDICALLEEEGDAFPSDWTIFYGSHSGGPWAACHECSCRALEELYRRAHPEVQ